MNSTRIKIKDEGRFKIFCFIVFFITIMFTQDKLLFSQNYSNTQAVVVSKGDSLWNLASKYKNENEDTRRFIYKIQEINLLNTSELVEGQEIKIPVYAKK